MHTTAYIFLQHQSVEMQCMCTHVYMCTLAFITICRLWRCGQ